MKVSAILIFAFVLLVPLPAFSVVIQLENVSARSVSSWRLDFDTDGVSGADVSLTATDFGSPTLAPGDKVSLETSQVEVGYRFLNPGFAVTVFDEMTTLAKGFAGNDLSADLLATFDDPAREPHDTFEIVLENVGSRGFGGTLNTAYDLFPYDGAIDFSLLLALEAGGFGPGEVQSFGPFTIPEGTRLRSLGGGGFGADGLRWDFFDGSVNAFTLASGTTPSLEFRFNAVAVVEPSTVVLIGSGLLGLFGYSRGRWNPS